MKDTAAGPYLPRRTPDAEPYWEGTRQNELRYQVCGACGEVVFHARSICPYCLSEDVPYRVSSGWGSVYSFTVLHRAPNAAYAEKIPYVLAIVALDEGFHLFTELVNCDQETLEIGLRVHVVFERVSADIVLPKFEPVRE